MRIKFSNIHLNVVSQIYVSAIGILFFPLYLKLLGGESYGVVGLFTTVQAAMAMLDIGFSQTTSKTVSKYLTGQIDQNEFEESYNSTRLKVFIISILTFISFLIWTLTFSSYWLKTINLSSFNLQLSLILMFTSVVIRWNSIMYRGAILGSESIRFYSLQLTIIATLRFVLVIPSMLIFGSNIVVFFIHQLLTAIFEIYFLKWFIKKNIFHIEEKLKLEKINLLSTFTGEGKQIALYNILIIALTQIDKISLSSLLLLKEYGFFTIAALSSSSILVLSYPITTVTTYTILGAYNRKDWTTLYRTYQSSLKNVLILCSSTTTLLSYYSYEILMTWTQNQETSKFGYFFMRYYTLGNFFLVLNLIPFQLQFAYGELTLHIKIISLMLFTYTLSIFMLNSDQIAYLGVIWLIINVTTFIFGTYQIHKRFLKEIRFCYISTPLLTILFLYLTTYSLDLLLHNQTHDLLKIAINGIATFTLSLVWITRAFKKDSWNSIIPST